MKRASVLAVLVGCALVAATGLAAAGGNSADQLADAGFTCFAAGPVDNIHCLPPSSGNGAATNAKVFTPDGQSFLGTESLRFTDRDLEGVPCPKEGGTWQEVEPGLWACHHWKGKP